MTQDIWIGIEDSAGAASGWHFDGTSVLAVVSGSTVADIQTQLGDAPSMIVSDGQDAQPVPAAVLPVSLPLPALTQDKPRGYLDPVARLRVAGALATRRNWDGVICLPMAHVTHWCQISADEVVSFQSALTPTLLRALGATATADPQALEDTMSRPERLSIHLRSAELGGAADAIAGHLLGAELTAMRAYWLGQQVIVIGENAPHSDALTALGVPVEILHPSDAAREGLIALRQITL